MILKKRFFHPTMLAALLCGATATVLHAQDGRPPHEPPPSPLFDALDLNHDGVISADEIASSSASLKALLKNGATQITRQDTEPLHPSAGRERRERDEQNRDDDAPPRGHHSWMRPHHPPPLDDRAADESHPPRPAADDDRADHPHHRPPPPQGWRDDEMSSELDRPPHRPVGRDEHRPRHAEDDNRARNAADHPDRHGDDASEDGPHRHPPFMPLFDALDTNHDGVISADEITSAPETLKKLDKSGSGQIRREDLKALRPPRDHD